MKKQGSRKMSEERKSTDARLAEDIIAAFDREREEANELMRRHTEHVRASRAGDRPVSSDRRQHKP